MTRSNWFLPESPDVTGLLRAEVEVTGAGLDAFRRWAGGEVAAAAEVEAAETRADAAKRNLMEALRAAFLTALEPEDVFALSRGIWWTLSFALDVVKESEAMGIGPDAGMAEMAASLLEGVRQIDVALERIDSDRDGAIAAADSAVTAVGAMDEAYYRGVTALLGLDDMRERIGRRELYRRCTRIGEMLVDVAERVVYAVVKQS